MSWVGRGMMLIFCLNISLAFFTISLGGSDILSKWLTFSGDDGNKISLSSDANGSVPMTLETGSVGTGSSGFSFIDGLKMIFGFIGLLLVSCFLPIYWGYVLGLPLLINLFLFLLTFGTWLGIIFLIRGDGN